MIVKIQTCIYVNKVFLPYGSIILLIMKRQLQLSGECWIFLQNLGSSAEEVLNLWEEMARDGKSVLLYLSSTELCWCRQMPSKKLRILRGNSWLAQWLLQLIRKPADCIRLNQLVLAQKWWRWRESNPRADEVQWGRLHAYFIFAFYRPLPKPMSRPGSRLFFPFISPWTERRLFKARALIDAMIP